MPPIAELKGRPLGRVLQKMGKVTREQYTDALSFQKQKGGPLGQILIGMGAIKEADLNIALAAQQGFEVMDLEGIEIDAATIASVSSQMATTNKVLPIKFNPSTKELLVAMASHENFRVLDDLRSLMQYNVTAKIASTEQLDRLIAKYYKAAAEGLGEVLGELNDDETPQGSEKSAANRSTSTASRKPPTPTPSASSSTSFSCRPSRTKPPTFTSSPSKANSRCATASTACSTK